MGFRVGWWSKWFGITWGPKGGVRLYGMFGGRGRRRGGDTFVELLVILVTLPFILFLGMLKFLEKSVGAVDRMLSASATPSRAIAADERTNGLTSALPTEHRASPVLGSSVGFRRFSSRDELDTFFAAGRGFVLNHYRNCLHRVDCEHYLYARPGLTYTKTGYETAADVLCVLGSVTDGKWYPCPTCCPDQSIGW